MCFSEEETSLVDANGRTVAMGSRDQMFSTLKHHKPDGEYAIVGPRINMTFYRENGMVFPSSGFIDGGRTTPRNKQECIEVLLEAGQDEDVS